MSLRLYSYTTPCLYKSCLGAASARHGRRLDHQGPPGTPHRSGAALGRPGRPPGGHQGPAGPRESSVRGTACIVSRVNPTSARKTTGFAPPPIAFAPPREARGSLGWTARVPSTTLSAKNLSVSPRISICDRANMALWLKGQTARTRFRSTDETLFGREASLAHDPDGSGHRS